MGLIDLFWRKPAPPETRASGTGYTAQLMAARKAYIAGGSRTAELTATVQSCVTLWENGLSLAHVEGTDLLTRQGMAIAARALALRGEILFLIRDRLIPVIDWDLSTRDGQPRAYRVTVPEVGGGYSETVLAAEVLHFRLAADPGAPWAGQPPLRRASLTAGLLDEIERALPEVWQNAPLGSLVVPFPESQEVDLEAVGRSFTGRRGRVMMRESVNVTAAGGLAPATDWRPAQTTPDLGGMAPVATLGAARAAICGVFGVLPALLIEGAQGPLVREAQRHLAQWFLQPMAMMMAEEASAKLGGPVMIDVMRPLQAFDSGNRARSAAAVISALAEAKAAGLDAGQVDAALSLVNWGKDDGAA
ncbi:MAG: phage portal protein [Paracoccus sp. (in: a-proteobacteria)]|uniref:phage portal protein n=1 Tax=Paracoccus sp. TaxID=267 RepID=UPI0026DF04EC|nr:phage portal protein [Paracoccus sp. (in: a-proteobacteria)]MDO5613627.1 phage portal protein [Paracoccus sp. (in: a-proteobacteria)]